MLAIRFANHPHVYKSMMTDGFRLKEFSRPEISGVLPD